MDPGVMSSVVRLLKRIVRYTVTAIDQRQLRKRLIAGLNGGNSEYDFTERDVDIHVLERFVKLPAVMVDSAEERNLVKVTVSGDTIFWPARLPTKDLPWLHHEIFDAYDINPSSYDHPGLNYEGRTWVIDAGAAEGYFSIFALRNSRGMVISVEPLSLMKTALAKTLSLYASGERAVVVTAALGDMPGWSEILVDEDHVCDSKLQSPSGVDVLPKRNAVTERVRVTTIDQLAEHYTLGGGGLVKMDIEGYEMAALRGAVNTLREKKPALAIAVYHELKNARRCAEIIKDANPTYRIEFRGYYGYFSPPRPYMVFAT